MESTEAKIVEEMEAPLTATTMDFFKRAMRSKGVVIGGVIILLFVLVAITAPWITHYDPYDIQASRVFRSPSTEFFFGTDNFGRDIFTRIVYGTRISLFIGLVATGVAGIAGVMLGLIAGFYGGRVDDIIGRTIDVMLAFPGILLALMIIITLGPSLFNVMIAVGFSRVPQFARLVRGEVLSVRERDFVQAARAGGSGGLRIMVRHVLPNIFAPILVFATMGVGTSILAAASLGYLGLGAQPPTPEWGLMLSEARPYMRHASWTMTFPGMAIMVTVIAINLLGDGLRDVLDPRMRGR